MAISQYPSGIWESLQRIRRCLLEIATSGFALLAMTREEGALRLVIAPLRIKQAPSFVIARLRRSRGNLAVHARNTRKPRRIR